MKNTLLVIFLLIPFISKTQWNGDPLIADNKVITTSLNDYNYGYTLSDNNNGSIVITGSKDFDSEILKIYAQRIDLNGFIKWGTAESPVLIFDGSAEGILSDAVEDGNGGAYIGWLDYRNNENGDIYLQHVNNSGIVLWTQNGIKVTNNANTQKGYCRMAKGLNGGVIITWYEGTEDEETGDLNAEVYVQSFSLSGSAQWPSNIPVSTVGHIRFSMEIISDGSGGGIVVFSDARNSVYDPDFQFSNCDLYAQKVNQFGNRVWGDEGKLISNAYDFELVRAYDFGGIHPVVSDGNGGAIIVFQDSKDHSSTEESRNIYAQHIDASGNLKWDASGVPINTDGKVTTVDNVVSDINNGAVVGWSYAYDDDDGDSRIIHINSAGNSDWSLVQPDTHSSLSLINDGIGNYIYTWSEFLGTYSIIKAQKISNTGAKIWAAEGVPVCTNPAANANEPQAILSDNGSAIITWEDIRNLSTTKWDIYAAKILGTSVLPVVIKEFTGSLNQNNIVLNWLVLTDVEIKEFKVERAINNYQFKPITTLVSKSQNSLQSHYQFTDNTAPPGKLYYRLIIVEKDGKETVSNIIYIDKKDATIFSVNLLENPARNMLNFSMRSSKQINLDILITDVNGRFIRREKTFLNPGSTITVSYDISNLSSGQYFLTFKDEFGIIKTKKVFIKL